MDKRINYIHVRSSAGTKSRLKLLAKTYSCSQADIIDMLINDRFDSLSEAKKVVKG